MKHTGNEFLFSIFTVLAVLWTGFALISCGNGGGGGGGGGGGTTPGNITIVMNTVPDDGQDFSFKVTGDGLSPFSLDDDSEGTLSNTKVFNDLAVGAVYTFSEVGVCGWSVTNISCVGGASTAVDYTQGKATVNLGSGEDVTCTFTTEPQVESLFVSNTNADTISVFTVNESTGELTFVETKTLSADSAPTALSVSPDCRYLYSANSNAKKSIGHQGSSTVSVYFINSVGGLEEIGSPFAVPGAATLTNLSMHPSGNYLYGVNTYYTPSPSYADYSSVFSFGINNSTGVLNSVVQSSDADLAHSIAMHPSGESFFVGAQEDGVVGSGLFSFVVNTTDGTFSEEASSQYEDDGYNVWVAITPDASYLYTADANDGNVNGFSIDSTDGALTHLSGLPDSPFDDAPFNDQRALIVDPTGGYLYVTDWTQEEISIFSINGGTGALTPKTPFSLSGLSAPQSRSPKALATMGTFLYVVDYRNDRVDFFDGTDTGSLSYITNTTVGDGPKAILIVP